MSTPTSNPPKEEEESKEQPPTSGTSSNLPLDWTQVSADSCDIPIRLPRDVTTILPSETEIILVGTAGQKITKIGSDFSSYCNPRLNTLILRSHLIRKMEGLKGFDSLEVLELYDNAIPALEELEDVGRTLRVLDMSYNVIKDMNPVQFCPNLQELYLAQNKLKTISGLKHLTKLRKIDLGANRIRVMEDSELSGLINLEELWLGKNKIEKIQGIDKLTKLRRLDVQANRLTAVENLATQVDTLEELYLSHNAITNEGASLPTGLALPFTQLSTIDLSRNRLTDTKPFTHLLCLEELWISGNEIATFEDVQPLSALGNNLEGIYLEYNPVAKEFEYRKKVKEIIPSLNQIDADLIKGNSNQAFGGGVGGMETLEEKMKRMQNEAIQRAKKETEEKKKEKEKEESA